MTGRSVVLDTNVYVSAYAFGGVPAEIMRAAITHEIEIATSPAILAELARVLVDKLGFSQSRVEDVVRQIARVATVVKPRVSLDVIADDPDNRVLECALESEASFIVSGDRHLLELGEFEGVLIISCAEAAERWCGSS
ncbi:MAG: putative toxin-antitoxin system toxin component, PIN family [Coriobacteriia bacterium]|nr:putative toxin-antitoxin system toxin component, PIN family [Coriobacteriia bacterium]